MDELSVKLIKMLVLSASFWLLAVPLIKAEVIKKEGKYCVLFQFQVFQCNNNMIL